LLHLGPNEAGSFAQFLHTAQHIPEIDNNIEAIIGPKTEDRSSGGLNILTRAIKKLGFASHRNNLEKRDGGITAITGTVPPGDQGDRLTERADHRDSSTAPSGGQVDRSPADQRDFPTDWTRLHARGKFRAQGRFAPDPAAQKSGEGRADADSQALTSIFSLDGLATLLLAVLLFISPLYSFVFSQEPLPAYMLAAVAFAVHACNKIRKGKLDLFGSRLNTALLSFRCWPFSPASQPGKQEELWGFFCCFHPVLPPTG